MKKIEGKPIAEAVYEDVAARLAALKAQGKTPGLAVVLVGDNPASKAYVGSKDRKCQELGFHSLKVERPETLTQDELHAIIDELNADEAIHGILVQLPLPPHLDEESVIRRINPAKDVDGLHPVNVAKLAMDDSSGFAPCTPAGCQRMLVESGIEIEGQHVVIVGRSLLVGKTLALLLVGKGNGGNATVTIAHSRTRDLAAITRQADILVAAIGIPHFIGPEHVREGAVVIDVGINRINDPTTEKGSRLVGDVDFDAVASKCEAITPVPGGVGRMTIAMLMANTLKACEMADH
ncbi:MAG: bifunctional methylenetetrahydrofolate dehydrogenase/methenyltetrahydrofolate cyclohydrolase FolD [Verrucomicrobiota bacterium]